MGEEDGLGRVVITFFWPKGLKHSDQRQIVKVNQSPGKVAAERFKGSIFTYSWKERDKMLVYLFEFCFRFYQSGSYTV